MKNIRTAGGLVKLLALLFKIIKTYAFIENLALDCIVSNSSYSLFRN